MTLEYTYNCPSIEDIKQKEEYERILMEDNI